MYFSAFVAGAVAILLMAQSSVFAEETPKLLEKIEDHAQKIRELETEIATYEKDLAVIGGEKRTLESAVREIDLSRKKVTTTIQVEERRISALAGEIKTLEGEIGDTGASIETLREGLRVLLAQMHAADEQTLIENLLRSNGLENLWGEIDATQQVNIRLKDRVDGLEVLKQNLAETKATAEEKRSERLEHQSNLLAEKRALDITKREKNTLLTTTNEKESSYQKLLEEKRAAKLEFEAALRSLESELEYSLDSSRIPPAEKGVLAWPLKEVFITQKFGNTAFARGGAYNGSGHNGVDFRASLGTPVKSSLAGTITGTGNTDVYRGCYSYGKWILVKHANGLSTLYAHLSDISVSPDQAVATGEIIGFSGNTGYSTGPHLHFALYISEAVQLRRLGDIKSKTNCAPAVIPVAPLNAYLDPLEYL